MDRRNRVEELFHEAMALEPSARTPFLAEACSSEPGLLEEVTSLISAYEQPGSFIDTPAYDEIDLDDDLSDSLIGTSIGRYKVIRLIKRSGMGEVYLARDTHLPRDVALKLLPLMFTGDGNRLRRFTLEAEAASSLNHPNILTIHEIGHVHDVHYIATEFVDGETLRERLANGKLKPDEALEIAIGVTNALVASHAAGIVHRDIKPENIMIRHDGYVKVLDFGLAKLTQGPDIRVDANSRSISRMDTDPGTFMGTVGYLSPEQAKALEVDTRSDVFSLGVVLYEMITGQNPFNRDAFGEVIDAILRTEPEPLTLVAPHAPPSLQKIVTKALSKDKVDRYQKTADLLSDLRAVQAEFQQRSTPRKLTPRERWVRVGSGVVALIAIASLAIVVIRMLNRNRSAANDLSARLDFVDIQSWKAERGEGTIDARFSHDGKWIAFTMMSNEQESIWVKQALPGAAPRQLTIGTAYNSGPIWSPDDQQLAFVSTREGKTGIWSISPNGGPETFLSPIESSTVRTRSWSKDGRTIFYEMNNNLFGLDVATRTVTQLTQFASKAWRRHFSIAPLEDRICYLEVRDGQQDIWVASLNGESPLNVTNDAAIDRSPSWHPDGRRIVYTSKRGGAYQIWLAFIDGTKPTQVTVGATDHAVLDISSDGRRMLDDNSRDEAQIFAVDVNTGHESEFASGNSIKLWPTVSPDGGTVLFQSINPTGTVTNSTIALKRTTNDASIGQFATNGFAPSWSPDGARVAFFRIDSGKVELFTTNAAGQGEMPLTSGGVIPRNFNVLPTTKFGRGICWSEASDKVVYGSLKSGASNLWMVSADGSSDTQVSANGDPTVMLYEPTCGSGNRIAFTAESKRGSDRSWSLWIRDAEKTKRIFESKAQLRPIAWSTSGAELIAASADQEGETTEVNLISCSTDGYCHSIASFPTTYLWTVELASDGRTIGFVSSSGGADNIWLSDTSGSEPKRLTTNKDAKVFFPGLNWSPNGQTIYYGKQSSIGLITLIDNFE
ncbi:MAG TPA: protein kinase [Pyrinomonadaceae bacterium]|nr:protein kinase [Pyrinomonadaceae bacterium]